MTSDPPPESASNHAPEPVPSTELDTPFLNAMSSSPDELRSTWQTQLNEARLGIARKVKEQQDEDGWEFPELEEEEAEELIDNSPDKPRDRRESVVTEDGEEDDLVAELLRPGTSRANSQRESGKDEDLDPSIREGGAEGTEERKEEERDPANDRTCRICFDGEDDELGKLFSPCRCRGTVSFCCPSSHSLLLSSEEDAD